MNMPIEDSLKGLLNVPLLACRIVNIRLTMLSLEKILLHNTLKLNSGILSCGISELAKAL